jgi:nucleotide-binding universal stress UspA family protein
MANAQSTPTTILCAVDYSELSSVAMHQAVEIAREKNAGEIHFLHVSKATADDDEERSARRERLLAWLGERLGGAQGVPHTIRVVGHQASGDAASVITQMANDLLADLIVVGTHGRKGVERMVMGSVAEEVVRRAGCPVLVARAKVHDQHVPQIEPPCPRCVQTRIESNGERLWCDQHSERHGRRHTYYNTRMSSWVTERLNP